MKTKKDEPLPTRQERRDKRLRNRRKMAVHGQRLKRRPGSKSSAKPSPAH
ncbi:MAG: hypothetical protein HY461_02845 [Parcubacteria group bacterium]|nr:hypothetical protein [Parcubacteria group bacterium]